MTQKLIFFTKIVSASLEMGERAIVASNMGAFSARYPSIYEPLQNSSLISLFSNFFNTSGNQTIVVKLGLVTLQTLTFSADWFASLFLDLKSDLT